MATACYLAKKHGITNVAVLEAGWIGGGNTSRNTTIVRSNYLYPESARLYDFSVQQYQRLAQEINFNIMFSQRGIVTLAHSRHDLGAKSRWANAMLCNGIDAELLDPAKCSAARRRGLGLAMRAQPRPWAWTSCRTAPSRASSSRATPWSA